MRTAPILAALALLAASLALVPSAHASQPCDPDQGNPCDPQPIPVPAPDCRKVPDRPPLAEVTQECHVLVYFDPVSCPLGKQEVTHTYWRVTVTFTVCSAVDPPASSAAMQPPIYCVMAPCGPQDPVPDEPCKATEQQPVPTVTVYVFRDCTVQVDHKPYDCVWNCEWRVLVQGPPVTVRTYGQSSPETSAAAAAGLPDPCGPTAMCQGPECPEVFVATWQFLAYMGPHASVRVDRDCSREVHVDPVVEPVSASAAAALPGIQPPPQCLVGPCCFAPCPPPCDGCEPDPVPACREQPLHSATGASVYLRGDCSIGVVYDNRLVACPHNWTERTSQKDLGPADYSLTTCQPVLDCTCPPLLATSAAADLPDLPGPPTFPVCVTEPCDTVVCDHAYDAIGPVSYEFTVACGLVLTVGDFPCEASHYETMPVGPVLVRRQQCDPGNPPAPTG